MMDVCVHKMYECMNVQNLQLTSGSHSKSTSPTTEITQTCHATTSFRDNRRPCFNYTSFGLLVIFPFFFLCCQKKKISFVLFIILKFFSIKKEKLNFLVECFVLYCVFIRSKVLCIDVVVCDVKMLVCRFANQAKLNYSLLQSTVLQCELKFHYAISRVWICMVYNVIIYRTLQIFFFFSFCFMFCNRQIWMSLHTYTFN